MKLKLSHALSLMLFAITALCVFMLSACQQDPSGSNQNVSNIVTSPAHPALTYYGLVKHGDSTTYPAIYVMDADAKNQTAIYVSASSAMILGAPSWSPDGGSICFSQSDTGTGTYSIRAIDVSLNTSGLSMNTTPRTVLAMSDPTITMHNSIWSSTAAMDKIAYTMIHTTPRGEILYSLCVVPQSGGQPITVWTGFRPFS
jgi:hypothetical protein